MPGKSGLEISAGRMRETKSHGPSLAADRVTFHDIQQVYECHQVLSAWNEEILELGHTRLPTLVH